MNLVLHSKGLAEMTRKKTTEDSTINGGLHSINIEAMLGTKKRKERKKAKPV